MYFIYLGTKYGFSVLIAAFLLFLVVKQERMWKSPSISEIRKPDSSCLLFNRNR